MSLTYGTIYTAEKIENRKEMIDEIYRNFDVGNDDMQEAASSAEVGYPNEVANYYFLATCVQAGRNFEEEVRNDPSFDSYDTIREFAIDCVPPSTYAVWRLWLDFGRETDAYENLGNDVTIQNLESVAETQLYEYASRIIYSIAG